MVAPQSTWRPKTTNAHNWIDDRPKQDAAVPLGPLLTEEDSGRRARLSCVLVRGGVAASAAAAFSRRLSNSLVSHRVPPDPTRSADATPPIIWLISGVPSGP